MTGHFDPMPQVRAQLDPRNSSEVDFGQQAGCRLRAAAFEQRLRGGERSAFYAVVCQQPRHAPQKARIVNRPRSRLSAGLPYLWWSTLDLDQRNLKAAGGHAISRKIFAGRLFPTAWASSIRCGL